jgi:hypothetical protein
MTSRPNIAKCKWGLSLNDIKLQYSPKLHTKFPISKTIHQNYTFANFPFLQIQHQFCQNYKKRIKFRHVKKVSVFITLFEEECAALVRVSKMVTRGTIIVQGTAFFLV